MKQAYLVEFSIKTRVVIDLPEGTDPEGATLCNNPYSEKVQKAAIRQISSNMTSYLEDNMVDIMLDEECPYPCTKEEEKEVKMNDWFSQTDFRTMEKMFSLRHEDFDEAEGYQAFVNVCENIWKNLTFKNKEKLYKEHSNN